MMAQRSRAGAEIAIFLLVIGVAVISGLLCVDPELRQQATGWLMRQSWIKGSSSGDATAAPSRVRQQDVPPLAATAPPSSPEPRDNQSPVNLPPAVSPPAEPVVTPPPAPVPAVIHEPDAAPPADGTPDHPVAAAPPPEAAPPPALSDAAARNRAKVLWRRALDADAAHDFQKEVELYEQIKKLPREYWQTNLELNLKFARASAAAQK
jgi:hypothetical protein